MNIPFDTSGVDKLLQCIVGVGLFQILPHFGSVTSDPSQMRKFHNELQQAQRTNIHQDGLNEICTDYKYRETDTFKTLVFFVLFIMDFPTYVSYKPTTEVS